MDTTEYHPLQYPSPSYYLSITLTSTFPALFTSLTTLKSLYYLSMTPTYAEETDTIGINSYIWRPMTTSHKSSATAKSSKDIKIDKKTLLRRAIEDLDLKFSVKGYKSSEGEEVFAAPPSERSEDVEAWEEEGGR